MTITAIESMAFFDGVASEIVKASKGSARFIGLSLCQRRNSLSRTAGLRAPAEKIVRRTEVREIIEEARSSVWPRLNDESVKLVSPAEFTRHWSGLGVQFQLAKLRGAEGLALLGFYVREMGSSRLPLICVNTAHHPAAIGAAFSHEMGHHLVGRLFDSRKHHAPVIDLHRLRRTSGRSRGIGGRRSREPRHVFPEALAREIFLNPQKRKQSKSAPAELPDSVSTTVLNYFMKVDSALASENRFPPPRSFNIWPR